MSVTFNQLNLNENIHKAIEACGYTTPTPVQAKAIPEILEGKDVVATAQTGTGKTAAFVLPALNHLSEKGPAKKTRVLILTPTRELATQITKAAMLYGKYLKFNIVNLVGGMPYHQQIRELSRGADIIVATPGRLMDHMESKRVDLSGIEILVLDEADRMLDMGFIEDVEYIAKLTPAHRQTLLFSATMNKQLTNIVKHLLKHPVRIDLSTENMTADKIKQELYRVTSPHQKMRLLQHFLNGENIFKAIIFSATKINADKLARHLRDDGYAAAALHGDLRQNVRNRTIDELRRGKIQFLVATDVAARGIDIQDITHVFNYDLPRFSEDYVHRIGRTGRAGKKGIAISFVMPTDTRHLKNIERYIGQRLHIISDADTKAIEASPAPRREGAHRTPEHTTSHHERDREPREFRRESRDRGDRGDRPAKKFADRGDRSDRFEKRGSRDEERAPRRDRDDRAPRRGHSHDDSAPRRGHSSDERAPRRFSSGNSDRAPRRGGHDRDDRAPRRFNSDNDRAPRRGGHDRDDRAAPKRFSERRRHDDDSSAPRRRERTSDRHDDRAATRSDDHPFKKHAAKKAPWTRSKPAGDRDPTTTKRFADRGSRKPTAARGEEQSFKKRSINKDRWAGSSTKSATGGDRPLKKRVKK